NYYITLSPEPIKITNAELEDVEIVVSPDHMVFAHTDPLKGLTSGGTFILQSHRSPRETWDRLPVSARQTIRDRHINFFILDAFSVAKEHAPNPDLETRMMGVAFIGAVATKVDRIASGSDETAMLAKIEEQIEHKFGSKGSAVVSANMGVVRAGAARAQRVDYEEYDRADGNAQSDSLSSSAAPAGAPQRTLGLRDISLSRNMCGAGQGALTQGLFDQEYFDEILGKPFADGTVSEAPVLPGTGYFVPAGSAASKDKGLFRRQIPVFESSLCTGCMECALACPDSAIPNTVFTIADLLRTAAKEAGDEGHAVSEHAGAIAQAMRSDYLGRKDRPEVSRLFEAGATQFAQEDGAAVSGLAESIAAVSKVLESFPVARTRPFFDAMEKKAPGDGALFAATIDPWKCTGCLECVQVCGPNALIATEQDDSVLAQAQERFAFLSKLPNTPEHYSDPHSGPSLDLKRVFLNHRNYYSTIGGHGACRGCGEVTAIRQTMALTEELNRSRIAKHREELTDLVDQLRTFITDGAGADVARKLLATLERRLYRYEGPGSGTGPAGAVIANSTGCSSVYASTAPYNSYQQPWVNGLFQDAQPLAKGIFEGLAADLAGDVLAMRQARALLDGVSPDELPSDRPDWKAFSDDELGLMPAVLTIGGDGATYDIGFGAFSRILASGTPMKMLVLNTGAYSNTGGQVSTASLEGQDSDLARVGTYLHGKDEQRKELGILAAMHPNVLVVSTSTAYQAHFLKNVSAALSQNDYPAVIDVYTPCQPEHGIADDASTEQSKLAVKSRVSPLFVHEPQHAEFPDRFILAGNPNVKDTWARNRLPYLDDDGAAKTLELPYTPADFAYTEQRFRKHFSVLADDAPNPTPIARYIDLDVEERVGATPYIYATDAAGALLKIRVGAPIVKLTEQCRENWHLLQYLAGQNLDALRKENARLEKELSKATSALDEALAAAQG
ncbi:MAG: 2-oxoacid:acceptor oxidoreductase family protein, partial [Actinomycetaceae bacterium]|nr:2-oxoacid:acceptor oxidoreductase family protein [Actinomycetaceae bacterium]